MELERVENRMTWVISKSFRPSVRFRSLTSKRKVKIQHDPRLGLPEDPGDWVPGKPRKGARRTRGTEKLPNGGGAGGRDNEEGTAVAAVVEMEGTGIENGGERAGERTDGEKCAAKVEVEPEAKGGGSPLGEVNSVVNCSDDDDVTVLAVIEKTGEPDVHKPRRRVRNGKRYSLEDIRQKIGDLTVRTVVDKLLKEFAFQYLVKNGSNGRWVGGNSAGNNEQSSLEIGKCTNGSEKTASDEVPVESERPRQSVFCNEKGRQVEECTVVNDCTVEDCTDLIDNLTVVDSSQSLEGTCAIVNGDQSDEDCIPLTPPHNAVYEKDQSPAVTVRKERNRTVMVNRRSLKLTNATKNKERNQSEDFVTGDEPKNLVKDAAERLGVLSLLGDRKGISAENDADQEKDAVSSIKEKNCVVSVRKGRNRVRAKKRSIKVANAADKKRNQSEGSGTGDEPKNLVKDTGERLIFAGNDADQEEDNSSSIKEKSPTLKVMKERRSLELANATDKKRNQSEGFVTGDKPKNLVKGTGERLISVGNDADQEEDDSSSIKEKSPAFKVMKERNLRVLVRRHSLELAKAKKRNESESFVTGDKPKNLVKDTGGRLKDVSSLADRAEISAGNNADQEKDDSSSIKERSPTLKVVKERNLDVMVKRRSLELAKATESKESNQSVTGAKLKNLVKDTGGRLKDVSLSADATEISAGNDADQEKDDSSSIKEKSPTFKVRKRRNLAVLVKRCSLELAKATKSKESNQSITGDKPTNLVKDAGERLKDVSPLADKTEISARNNTNQERGDSSSISEKSPTLKVGKERYLEVIRKRRSLEIAKAKKRNQSEGFVTADKPKNLVKDTGERLKGVSPLADGTEVSGGNDADQEKDDSSSIKEKRPTLKVGKERRSLELANAADKKRNQSEGFVTGDKPKNLVKETGKRLGVFSPLADKTEISAGNDADQEKDDNFSIKEKSLTFKVGKAGNLDVMVKRHSLELAKATKNKKRDQSEGFVAGDEPKNLVKDTGERLKDVSPLADKTEISARNDTSQERGDSSSISEKSPTLKVRKGRNPYVMVKRHSLELAKATENRKRNQSEGFVIRDEPKNLVKDAGERLKGASPLADRTDISAGNDADQARDDSTSVKEKSPVVTVEKENCSVVVSGKASGLAIATENEKGSQIEDCTTVSKHQNSVGEIGDTLDSISDLVNETGMLMRNDVDNKEDQEEIEKHSSVKDQSIIHPAKKGRNLKVLAKTQTVEARKESDCVAASVHKTGMSVGNEVNLKEGDREVGEKSSIKDPSPVVTTKRGRRCVGNIERCNSKLTNASVNQKRNQIEDFRTEDELRSIVQKICENHIDIPALMDKNGMLLGYDIDPLGEQGEIEGCSSVNDQSLIVSAKKESTVLVNRLGSKQVNISDNKKGNRSGDCITVNEPSQANGEKLIGISAVGGLSVVNDVDPKKGERDRNPVVMVKNVRVHQPLVKRLRSGIHTIRQRRGRTGPDVAVKGLRLFSECFVVLERLKMIPPAVENREVKPTEKHVGQYDSGNKVEHTKQARGKEILRNSSAVSNGETNTEVKSLIEELKSSSFGNKITVGESAAVTNQYGTDADNGRQEEMKAVEDSSVVDSDKGQATSTVEPSRAESKSDISVALNIECGQSMRDTSIDNYQRLSGELKVIKAREITENVLRPIVEEVVLLQRESENANRTEDKECTSQWRIEKEIMKDGDVTQPKGQIKECIVAENYLKEAEDKGTDGGCIVGQEKRKSVLEDEVLKKYTAEKKDEGTTEDTNKTDKETTLGEYVPVVETEKVSAEDQVLKETELQIERCEVEKENEYSDEAKDKNTDEEGMLHKKKEQLIEQDEAKKHVIEKEPKEMNELNNKQKVVEHTNNRKIERQAIVEESIPDGEREKQVVNDESVEKAGGEIEKHLVVEVDNEKTEDTNKTCNRTAAEGSTSDRKSEEVIAEDEVVNIPEIVEDEVVNISEVIEDEVAKVPIVEDEVTKLPEVVADEVVKICEVPEDEVAKNRIVENEVAKILKVIADGVAKIPMIENEVAKIPEVVVDEVVKIAKVQIENSSVKVAKATSEMKDNRTFVGSTLDKTRKSMFVGDKVVKKDDELIGKDYARKSRDTKLGKNKVIVAESTSDKKREMDVEDKTEMCLVKKDEREIEKTKEVKDMRIAGEYSPEQRKERLIVKEKVPKETEEQNKKECKKCPSETTGKRIVVVRTSEKKRKKQIVKNKGAEGMKELTEKSALGKEGECKTVKERHRVIGEFFKGMREKQIVKDGVCAGGKEIVYINKDIKVRSVENQEQKLTGVTANKGKFKKTIVLKEVHGLFKSRRDENEQSTSMKIAGKETDTHLQGKDTLQIKMGERTDESPAEKTTSKPKFRVRKRLRNDDKGFRKIKMTEEMRRRKFEKYLAEKKRVGLFNKYIVEKTGSQISSEDRKEKGSSDEVCRVKKEEPQNKKSPGEKSAENKDKVKPPVEKHRPSMRKEQTEMVKDEIEKGKCIIKTKLAKKIEKNGEEQIEKRRTKEIRENKDPKEITKHTHRSKRSLTKQYTVKEEVRLFGDQAEKKIKEKVREISGDGVAKVTGESQGKYVMSESKKEVQIENSAERPVGTKEAEEDIKRCGRSTSDAESKVQASAESKDKRPKEETFIEQKKSKVETAIDGKITVGQDIILKGVQNQTEIYSLAVEDKILNDANLVMKESNLKGDAEIIGELDEKMQQTVDHLVVEDRQELNSELKYDQTEKCSIVKDETSGNRECMIVKEGGGCDKVTEEEEQQFNHCAMVRKSMNQDCKKIELSPDMKGEIPSQEQKQGEDITVMIEGAKEIQESAICTEEERQNEESTEVMKLIPNGELVSRNRGQSGDYTIVTKEKDEVQTCSHPCTIVKEGDGEKEKYGLLSEDSRGTVCSKREEIVSREVQIKEHVVEEQREIEALKGEGKPVTSSERAHEVCRTENEGLSEIAAEMIDVHVGPTLREERAVEGEGSGQSETQHVVEGFVDAEDNDIWQAEEKNEKDEECGIRSKAHEDVEESAVAEVQQNEEPEIRKKMHDGVKENEIQFEEGNKLQGSVVVEEEQQNVDIEVKKKALQEFEEGVMIEEKDAKDEVLEDVEKCAMPMEGETQDKDSEVGNKPQEDIEECALVKESDTQIESGIENKMQGEVECAVFEEEGKQSEYCDVGANVERSETNMENEEKSQESVVRSGEGLECARAKEAEDEDRATDNSTHEVVEENAMENEEYDFGIRRKAESEFDEGEIVTGEKQTEAAGTENKTEESIKSKAEESKEYMLEKDRIVDLSDEDTVVLGELSPDSARQTNIDIEYLKSLDVRGEEVNKVCECSLDTIDDKEVDGSAVESQQEVKLRDYVPSGNLSIESTCVSDDKVEIPSEICRSDSEVESRTVISGSENQIAVCAIQPEGDREEDLCTIERIRQFIESTVEGGEVAQTGLDIVNNLEERCGSICSVDRSGKRQLCVCGIENEGQVCSFETDGEDSSHLADYTINSGGGNFMCSGAVKDNANGQILLCSVSGDEPRVLKEHTVDGNIISISVPAVEGDMHVGPRLADVEVERHVKVCTIENESERHIGDCTVESGLEQGARCCTVEITRVIETEETDSVNRELGASRIVYDQNGGIITLIQNPDTVQTNVTDCCGENGESVIQVHITEDGVQKGESDFESEVEQEAENELEEEVLENVNDLGETIIEEFVDKDTWENQIVIVMEGVEAVQVETPDAEPGVMNAKKRKGKVSSSVRQSKPRRPSQSQETPRRARGRPKKYMQVERDSEGLANRVQQNANSRSKKTRVAHPWESDGNMLEEHLSAQQNSNVVLQGIVNMTDQLNMGPICNVRGITVVGMVRIITTSQYCTHRNCKKKGNFYTKAGSDAQKIILTEDGLIFRPLGLVTKAMLKQMPDGMDMPPVSGAERKFEGKWKKAMISKVMHKEAQLAAAEIEKALGNDPLERSAIKKGLRRRSRSQGNQASAVDEDEREPVYTEHVWREALESPMIISGLKETTKMLSVDPSDVNISKRKLITKAMRKEISLDRSLFPVAIGNDSLERGANQKGGRRSQSQGNEASAMNMDDRDPAYTEHVWREALESPVIIPGLKEVSTGLSEDGMNKARMSPRKLTYEMNLKKNGDSPVVPKQKMVRRPKKAIIPLPTKKMFKRFKEIPQNIKADFKNKLLGSVQLIRRIILTRKDLARGVLKPGRPFVTGGTQILSIMTDSEEEDIVPTELDKIDGTGAKPILIQADQPHITTSPLKEVQNGHKENDFNKKDIGNVLPSNCKPNFKKPRVARPPKKLNKEEKVIVQDALCSMPDLSISPVENMVVTNGLPESDAQNMMVVENLSSVDQTQLEETSLRELTDSTEGHALSEVPPKHQGIANGLLQSSTEEQRNQDESSESNTIKASNEQMPPSTLGTKDIPNVEVIMGGPTVPLVQHKDQIEKPQEKKIKQKKTKVKVTEGGGFGRKPNDLALKEDEKKNAKTFDKVEENSGLDVGNSARPPVVTPPKKALTASLKEKNAKNKVAEVTSSKKPEEGLKRISSPLKALEASVTGSLQQKDVTCQPAKYAGKDSSADKSPIIKTPRALECSILPLKPLDSDIINALPSLEELMGSSAVELSPLNDEAARNNGDKKDGGKLQPTLPLKKKISREILSKATAVEDNSESPDAEQKKIIEKIIGSDPKKKPSRGELLLIDMFTNSVGKVSEKEKTVTGKPFVKKTRISPVVSSQTKTPPDKSTESGAKKIKAQGLILIDLFKKEKEKERNLLKKSDKKDVVSGKVSPKEGLKSPVTSPQYSVAKDSSSAEMKTTVIENHVVNKVYTKTVSVHEYLKRKHSQEGVGEGLTAKKLKSESKENTASSVVPNLSEDPKKSDGKKQTEKERRKSIQSISVEAQEGLDAKKLKSESKENTSSSSLPNLSVDSKKLDGKKSIEKERRKSDHKTVQSIPFGVEDSSSKKKTEKIIPVLDGSCPAQDETLPQGSNETDVSGAGGTAEDGQEGHVAKKLKPESMENTDSSNLPNLSVDSKKSDGNKPVEKERRMSDRKTVQNIPFGVEDSSSNKKTEKITPVFDGSFPAQDEKLPQGSNETDASGASGTAEAVNGEVPHNIANGLQSSEAVISGTKEAAKITINDVNHSLPLQQIYKLRECFVLLHRLPEDTVNSLRPFRRKIKKRKKINTQVGVPGAEDQTSTRDNSAVLERLSPGRRENISSPLPAEEEQPLCPQSPSKKQLHVCEVCGERFSAASILFAHTKKHSQEESSLSSPERKMVLQDRPRPSVRKKESHLCPYCLRKFKGKKNFIRHLKRHPEAKACKCYMCDKTFLTYYNLFVHMRTHTRDHIYPCYICQKTFAHPTTLQMHIEEHHTKKRFKCFSCEKSFMSVVNRIAHMRKHHENKPV